MIQTKEPEKTGGSDLLALRARDVAGMQDLRFEIHRDLPVSAVTETLVERMSLPTDVSWAIRNDKSVYLDDAQPIGGQVEADSQLTVTPKAHLG